MEELVAEAERKKEEREALRLEKLPKTLHCDETPSAAVSKTLNNCFIVCKILIKNSSKGLDSYFILLFIYFEWFCVNVNPLLTDSSRNKPLTLHRFGFLISITKLIKWIEYIYIKTLLV